MKTYFELAGAGSFPPVIINISFAAIEGVAAEVDDEGGRTEVIEAACWLRWAYSSWNFVSKRNRTLKNNV